MGNPLRDVAQGPAVLAIDAMDRLAELSGPGNDARAAAWWRSVAATSREVADRADQVAEALEAGGDLVDAAADR